MKIQLTYDPPARIGTDLLVVILDPGRDPPQSRPDLPFRKRWGEWRRRFADKRLKTDYFTALDSRAAGNLAVYSSTHNPGYNIWENVKIFVARAIRRAGDHGFHV